MNRDTQAERGRAADARERRPEKPEKDPKGSDGSAGEAKPEQPAIQDESPEPQDPSGADGQAGGAAPPSQERSAIPKAGDSILDISIEDPCQISGEISLSGPYTGRIVLRLTYHVTGSPDYVPSESSWSHELQDEARAGFLLAPPWDHGPALADGTKISSYRVEVEEAVPALANMTAKSVGFRCDGDTGGGLDPSVTPTATSEPSSTPGATVTPEPTETQLPTSTPDPTNSAVPTATDTPQPTPVTPSPTPSPSPTSTPTPRPGGATRIAPDNRSTAYPGAVAVYAHTVTNLGASADVKELAARSSKGWPVAILGADGKAPLRDSNWNGSSDTGLLEPGESRSIVVVVTVPVDAHRGTRDITSVAARSAVDLTAGGSDSATDTTTVLGVIALSISTPEVSFGEVSPTGAMPTPASDLWSQADEAGASFVKSNAVQISVSSNSTWTGEVRAMENSGTASTIRITEGDLQWRLSGDESWTNLTLSPNGFAAGPSGSSSMEYDYRLRVDWEDDPGSFASVVSYNVSQ